MKQKRTLKIAGNVVVWVIFALALLTLIMTFNPGQGISNFMGLGYLSVQSDSMEPKINEDDLIFVRTTSADSVFEIDDVVTFKTVIGGEPALNTHRIIGYTEIAGTRYYTTKGDNEEFVDLGTITSGDIVAVFTGFKLNGFGKVFDFLQTSAGYFLLVVLPLAGLFVYQVVNFTMLMSKYKKVQLAAEGNVSLDNLTEEQKEEIARKYLESLNKKEDKQEETEKYKKEEAKEVEEVEEKQEDKSAAKKPAAKKTTTTTKAKK